MDFCESSVILRSSGFPSHHFSLFRPHLPLCFWLVSCNCLICYPFFTWLLRENTCSLLLTCCLFLAPFWFPLICLNSFSFSLIPPPQSLKFILTPLETHLISNKLYINHLLLSVVVCLTILGLTCTSLHVWSFKDCSALNK